VLQRWHLLKNSPSIAPAWVSDITSTPAKFFQYLARDPNAWKSATDQSYLPTWIRLAELQASANNGGMLSREQLDSINRETSPSRLSLAEAACMAQYDIVARDFQRQLDTPPTTLMSNRPRYYPFGHESVQTPWSNSTGHIKTNMLKLIGKIERDLLGSSDADKVKRARSAIAHENHRLANVFGPATRAVVEDCKLMLRDFSALIERLYPAP
jgi:hypothetical protein